ncbi:MAG: discoidin domain-containing protein, partial [Bryocella sp.]
PPGEQQWIEWTLPADTKLPGSGYVRFDLLAEPDVVWHVAGAIEPGHVAAFEMSPGKMRRYSSGVTLALQVHPPQASFGAGNVLSGVTRPHETTNLWRSDPTLELPQWLQLAWDSPQEFSKVVVTFPGHLLREYHAYAPFYRDPQCVRDYDVQLSSDGASWRTVAEVRENYQRRNTIEFERESASYLRILVLATNGDPSAAIYEVRAYR